MGQFCPLQDYDTFLDLNFQYDLFDQTAVLTNQRGNKWSVAARYIRSASQRQRAFTRGGAGQAAYLHLQGELAGVELYLLMGGLAARQLHSQLVARHLHCIQPAAHLPRLQPPACGRVYLLSFTNRYSALYNHGVSDTSSSSSFPPTAIIALSAG